MLVERIVGECPFSQALELEQETKRKIHDLEGRLLEEELGRVKAVDETRMLQGQVRRGQRNEKTGGAGSFSPDF